MKALKLSLMALSFSSLFLSSCKKEDKIAPANSNTNVFARTLKVSNAEGTSNATLRFRSLSNDVLKSLALDEFDFSLVKTPMAEAGNSSNLTTTSLGKLNFAGTNVNRQPGGINELQPSDKVIYVDLVSDSLPQGLTIEVKSKVLNVKTGKPGNPAQTLYPNGVQVYFYGATNWHRIQIDNLSSNAINVAFYYNSCDGNICSANGDLKGTFTQYSGYSYNLYTNGWAWYSNCNRAVGALVTIAPNTYYWFRWTAWTNC